MSTTSWADAPTPAFTAEQFPRILGCLTLASPQDRSALTVLGLHAINPALAADTHGKIALRLDDALTAAIEARDVIYPLRHAAVGDDYCIEYIAPQRTLWLKYQQILGSRLLIRLTDPQAARFEDAIRRLLRPRQPVSSDLRDATLLDEIGLLTVRGGRIELPALPLQHYPRIKALIQQAGGRYAHNGFSFGAGSDLEAVLAQLLAGEQPNPKKERQAFFTPPELAVDTVALAAQALGGLAGKRVLEPSAGDGALADEARAAGADVFAVEIHGPSAQTLRDKGYEVREGDFLSLSPEELGLFDAVIANPPFRSNQDVAHVNHMQRFLRPGGVLVSLMSPSWQTGRTRVQREFRAFAETVGASVEALPAGSFKASGTNVSVLRVCMHHPAHAPRPQVASEQTA
ncbi:methyltransferase domain-containing protein [Burkholderia cenocepacia]|uniref:methyltransferase domain-containing protein n=1 Tax=Burkholderia cenocepacia TaxID=95486 RepID=UPI0024B6CCE1|nr:class I SAM-dependent methyltransferase [Burkholderia cenocepacia]MDI9688525.1 class I SAM-dependent methyltransferase [Burkholderia cenocepacia]